ncbi:hypothetical protein IRJ41_021177 [Triplophysa rosa]|uniref:Uncharacterized protein n=1 Tax=Triplophysa rosa TaxID=992332 RepID=A0A9W7TL18_TRIRA|nr:hypothetical protein IRJ41_021177 [Triplophysa rosa]
MHLKATVKDDGCHHFGEMRQRGDIPGAVSTPSAVPDPETLHFLDKIEGRSAEPLTPTEMFEQKDAVLAKSTRPRSCQHLQTGYALRR